MRRKRQAVRSSRLRRHSVLHRRPQHSVRPGGDRSPINLHQVPETAMGCMNPGDVVLLPEADSLRSVVDPIFHAVLACPACGTLGLITSAQYFGAAAVTCGSDRCSCHFRIHNTSYLIYLPVN